MSRIRHKLSFMDDADDDDENADDRDDDDDDADDDDNDDDHHDDDNDDNNDDNPPTSLSVERVRSLVPAPSPPTCHQASLQIQPGSSHPGWELRCSLAAQILASLMHSSVHS